MCCMKREELRSKYIKDTCDKYRRTLRRFADSSKVDRCYIAELANDIEREVDAMLSEDKVAIGFKRLSDDAIIPTKAHPTDSGYDLYANEDVIIEPGDTAIVKTGIDVELPKGYEAQLRPRSGITAKTKLRVQLGTIDNDYRGELGVIVDNIAIKAWTDKQLSPLKGGGGGSYLKDLSGNDLHVSGKFRVGTHIIRKGDRIAQLVIQRLPETVAVEIDEFSEDSERGDGGFGSSGV